MANVPPALDRASGSFRHSERYAATAARYSRALERERNAEEIARDGASGSGRSGNETESLLGEPGYLERERRKNESFRRGCGRACVAVFVLAAFAGVAALGFQHFSKDKADAVAVDPSPTPARSPSSASSASKTQRSSAEVSAWSTSTEKAGNSSQTHTPPPPPPPPMSEEKFEEVAADEATDLVADAIKKAMNAPGGMQAALLGRKRERIGHKFKPLSNSSVTPETGDGEPVVVPTTLPKDPIDPKDPRDPIKLPAEGDAKARSGR